MNFQSDNATILDANAFFNDIIETFLELSNRLSFTSAIVQKGLFESAVGEI